MIINVLQANPGEHFTARKLAQKIIETYKDELTEKRKNTRFASDEDFLNQITAEVGGSRTVKAKAMCTQVMTRDKPRPRNKATKSAVATDTYALTYETLTALISDARALLTKLCESQLAEAGLAAECARELEISSVRADKLVQNYLIKFVEE